jgi:hypothetical protein
VIPLASFLFASGVQAADFEATSPTFVDGKFLPAAHVLEGFGCHGGNRSPAIAWSGAPPGTKSFAVTLYDPDAPTGSGWWHWTVFNIPAAVASLPEGAGSPTGPGLPDGAIQGRTDFGAPGFGGACPPEGDPPHHYVLTVWALKVEKLPLDASAGGRWSASTLMGTLSPRRASPHSMGDRSAPGAKGYG